MGRLLETLKQAETQRYTPRLAPLPEPVREIEDVAATEPAETEIPFIEWGPRKSMEASASVLAVPVPVTPRVKDETAVALVPPTGHVQFRALPGPKAPAIVAPELSAFHDPEGALAQQYREVLKSLLATRPAEEPHALLFTAAHAECGTTTALLNAAITAAKMGRRRIAVVDAHQTKPAIAAALGLPEKPGLREVLAGLASLEDALQDTAQPGLTALTAGVTQATGGVRFLAETMRSLLRHLRQGFDLIFVDTAAWDDRLKTLNLAAACDAVYLVLSPYEADSPEVDDLLRHIADKSDKLAGCIVAGR